MQARVTIPGLPPPTNNLYPTGRDGRRHLSKRGREWHQTVSDACVGARLRAFPGPRIRLAVALELVGLDYRSDIDGRVKAALDALGAALGFDDRWIDKLVVERVQGDAKETRATLTFLPERLK